MTQSNNKCNRNCNCCKILCQGPMGPPGPPGTLVLSNYLTSRVTISGLTVPRGDTVTFGRVIDRHGDNITHAENTDTFTLVGGQTYQITFSINGLNTNTINPQGMSFQLQINGNTQDSRVQTQNSNPNSPFSSGTAIAYVTVPQAKTWHIRIINNGLDNFVNVNGNISILQITNN